MARHRIFGLFGVVLVGLGACASNSAQDDRFAYVEEPVEKLYLTATEALEKRRYEEAIVFFAEVERQHPYSEWARRSMMMTAYSQYLTNDYDASLESIDRFLSIHPGNKDAGYAYYLKAMNHYERIRDVGRDQDITRNALAALEDVIRRYPESEYARDARLKLDLTYDHLAGKEMDVGRYYLRRGEHVAAINRFNRVLTDFQTTTHTPEALHRLVESYLQIGVIPEARRHAAVLGHNFPDSEWYIDSFELFESRGLKAETVAASSKHTQ